MQPNTSRPQQPQQSQQSQQMEGKRSKWKLFSRGKTNSTEALAETSPVQRKPDDNCNWETNNVPPRSVDANISRSPINLSMSNSSAVAIDAGVQAHSSPAASNVSGAGASQMRHTQPQVQTRVQPHVQPQVQVPPQTHHAQSTTASTASPTVRQETYVDPVTGETTTTTTITTVVTTVVTKPPPTSPVADELDMEEERRLASELLAASEADDAHAPRLQGLQPAPMSRDRRSRRLVENTPLSARAVIPVDEMAGIVSSRPGPQQHLLNGHKLPPHSQQGHNSESRSRPDDDRFADVDRPAENRPQGQLSSGKKIMSQTSYADPPVKHSPPTRDWLDDERPVHDGRGRTSLDRTSLERSRPLPGIREIQESHMQPLPRPEHHHRANTARSRSPPLVFPLTPPLEPLEPVEQRDQPRAVAETASKRGSWGTFGGAAVGHKRGEIGQVDKMDKMDKMDKIAGRVNPLASHPVKDGNRL